MTHFPTEFSGDGVKAKLEGTWNKKSSGSIAVVWAGEDEGLGGGEWFRKEISGEGPQGATTLGSELLLRAMLSEWELEGPLGTIRLTAWEE